MTHVQIVHLQMPYFSALCEFFVKKLMEYRNMGCMARVNDGVSSKCSLKETK